MSFADRQERAERASGPPASAQTVREAAASRPIYQVKAEFFKTLAQRKVSFKLPNSNF